MLPLIDLLDARMSQNLILLPVLAQVLLTFAVLLSMGPARSRSIRARRQAIDDVALATDRDWEPEAVKRSNNFKNQFELPVLFYAVTGYALMTRNVDMAFFLLAWAFVASRIVHTVIHVGANKVRPRATAYVVGFAALIAMWALLMWRVAAQGF